MAKYFSDLEIQSLDKRLIVMLDQLRSEAEMPIIITCGYRSPEDNEKIGGVKDSAHTLGLAVDIRCGDSLTRYKLVRAAYRVGFKRIGAETAHLHLDISETLPQNVMFLGVSR